jgi:hypothetical protein
MTAAMSYGQAPPVGVPLRFFLTAPLFGGLAGLLLALKAPEILASRWSGETLGAVHLVTLGLMLQAMCGALLQLLPVAVGVGVWRPRWIGALTHVGLTLGTLLLVGGFLSGQPLLFRLAAPLLGSTLAVFAAATGVALLRTRTQGGAVSAMRGAVLGLAATAALGVLGASVLGWGNALPLPLVANLHAAWGLIGWALLLVVGVALLVVPMLQITPPYPKRAAQAFAPALLAALLVWSLARLLGEAAGPTAALGLAVMAALAAAFAVVTLRLQQQRRRRHSDPSLLFWRTALVAICIAAVLGVALAFGPEAAAAQQMGEAAGLVLLAGVFASVINGMLYKIVPFLIWLHLQQRMTRAPTANQLIAEASMRRQLHLHWAALACLALGMAWAPLLALGGVLFALSCGWLEANLARAAWRHLRAPQPAAHGAG